MKWKACTQNMSDFKVTERSAPVALTMAGGNDKNPMTR